MCYETIVNIFLVERYVIPLGWTSWTAINDSLVWWNETLHTILSRTESLIFHSFHYWITDLKKSAKISMCSIMEFDPACVDESVFFPFRIWSFLRNSQIDKDIVNVNSLALKKYYDVRHPLTKLFFNHMFRITYIEFEVQVSKRKWCDAR